MNIFSRSYYISDTKWQNQWFGVFKQSITESGHSWYDHPEEFQNLDQHFDCVFIHDLSLNDLQNEDVFNLRMERGERFYLIHHDNSTITQKPHLSKVTAQKLEDFYLRIKARCYGIIALNTYSYEVTLANIEEERKHLLCLPPVRREFSDQEGKGLLIYGRLRNKTETAYATLIALVSALSNQPLEIGSLNDQRKLQSVLIKLIKLTSFCHNIRVHKGKANLKGEEEKRAWDNCAAVIILRKQGHCNSAVLTKALAEGKFVLITEIDAVKRNFQSPDVKVVRNIFHLLLEFMALKRHLRKRRIHWRYFAASQENFHETFENYRVELDKIICQRPFARIKTD